MHIMSDMSERLRQARKQAGYRTMRLAADALGLHYPTYAGHENGWREFPHEAARYAFLFKVNLVWLMTGRGKPKSAPSDKDPILELYERIPPDKQGQAVDYLTFLADQKSK
jgi:hypothetical protein